ncbi:MAG TPA: hypothetical protein VNP98_17370 [Chthoniobacterales bacterium]|nr:hypothetical protein [Chthoniobacterales bacterium]
MAKDPEKDKNKIATDLTDEQLDQFILELAKLPKKKRRLVDIKDKAASLGLTVSLMSAKSFRDVTFARALHRMRTAKQVALEIEGAETGEGDTLKASRKMLSRHIFDELLEAAENETGVDVDAMTLSVSRLTRSDAITGALELKVRDYEKREREREEKKAALSKTLDKEQKRGGITAETRKLIDQELGAIA